MGGIRRISGQWSYKNTQTLISPSYMSAVCGSLQFVKTKVSAKHKKLSATK